MPIDDGVDLDALKHKLNRFWFEVINAVNLCVPNGEWKGRLCLHNMSWEHSMRFNAYGCAISVDEIHVLWLGMRKDGTIITARI